MDGYYITSFYMDVINHLCHYPDAGFANPSVKETQCTEMENIFFVQMYSIII